MSDTKYGTLFSDRKDFPADEPMFVLRGKDLFAPASVEAYATLLRAASSCADLDVAEHLRTMAREVSNIAAEMIAWQATNTERVKIPD